jgi:hypothetical protein
MHAFSIRKYLLFSATLLLLIALTGLAYAQIIFIPFYLERQTQSPKLEGYCGSFLNKLLSPKLAICARFPSSI